jgi:hypothetical protein
VAAHGLEFAKELADYAHERSLDPRREQQLERLTIEQLALENDLQPAQIARSIALERRQLFDELSDQAIYKRLQRQHGRRPRRCQEPGCTDTIPVTAPAPKRHCPNDATGQARTARHRKTTLEPPALAGASGGAHAHALSSRSVSTISMTSATVSSRAQSRWSSTASATQVTGCAPAWTTRSMPVRWASSLVPPIASTTG